MQSCSKKYCCRYCIHCEGWGQKLIIIAIFVQKLSLELILILKFQLERKMRNLLETVLKLVIAISLCSYESAFCSLFRSCHDVLKRGFLMQFCSPDVASLCCLAAIFIRGQHLYTASWLLLLMSCSQKLLYARTLIGPVPRLKKGGGWC